MYELFDHTADVGLRVRAADRPGLFADAGRGLFSLIVENIDAVEARRWLTFRLEGSSLDHLLVDWLAELLYTFDTRRMLMARFDVRVGDGSLDARAAGEPFDPSRHRLGPEVKAVTYHGLTARRTDDGYLAEVIVDI